MMFVRLAMDYDVDAVVELARMNVAETRPDMVFDDYRCRETVYNAVEHADPTIFVAEDKRWVVGFLLADMYSYRAAEGIFVTQEVLFVHPAKRGSRAATLLMKHLVAWAEQLGAKEIVGGNDNDFQSERTAGFLEHFGFQRVGFAMRRVMD